MPVTRLGSGFNGREQPCNRRGLPGFAIEEASIAGPDPAHDHPAIGIDHAAALEDATGRRIIGRCVVTWAVIGIGGRSRDGPQGKAADDAGRNGAAVVGPPGFTAVKANQKNK